MHPSAAYYAALGRLLRPTRAAAYPNTLSPMRSLLHALGEPQAQLRTVVVGGSVGKGTTAAYLAQLLQASGARVGLYSGPHLHSWRERFAINGVWITPEQFSALEVRVNSAFSENDLVLSTFELNTALALSWFAESAVDYAVLEAGIGGRWDAVNAATQALAVIAPIENEHANLLGGDLTSIAQHKAGLIPVGGQAISAPQRAEVTAVLREAAERRGASLTFVAARDDEPFTLARVLAEHAFRHLRPAAQVPVMKLVAPPGRYEWVGYGARRWLLDGGHTPRAGQQLARLLTREAPPPKRRLILLAMLRDKEVEAFVAPLDVEYNDFLLTTTYGNRALSAQELQSRAGFQRAAVSSVAEAAAAIRLSLDTDSDLVVVTGSLRLVAIAREELGLAPAALREEARLTRALLAREWKP